MFRKFNLVLDESQAGGGVTPEEVTPAPSAEVAQTTPAAPESDAEGEDNRFLTLRAQLEKQEHDLRAMKSSFQKREAQLQKDAATKEQEYQRQLDDVRRSLMDEDDLKEYEKLSAQEKAIRMQSELEQTRATLEQERAMREAIAALSQGGVPMDILLAASEEGLDSVSNAAWNWLITEKQRLETEVQKYKANGGKPPTPPPSAPKTAGTTSSVPASGPTWDDLIKKYGSEENVYNLVESQRLPASIIPGYKEP